VTVAVNWPSTTSGTGYASLATSQLPARPIKIDPSFVAGHSARPGA